MKSGAWIAIAGLTALMGCASAPLPNVYVLSPPAAPVATAATELNRPAVELRPVAVPDYLDTTDILVRDGQNELKASTTGQWGERLSVGITHALAIDLGRRLPGTLVAQSSEPGQPARKLLVNVEGFDIHPDGKCVLTARWTILRNDSRSALAAERDTFVTMVAASPGSTRGAGDAAVVGAMGEAVEKLAGRIATALERYPDNARNTNGPNF